MKVSSLEAASAPSAAVSRHALVVESDLDQRRRVVAQLSHWGYTPHAVASGEEALDALGERRFALALIAIRLPGMSGVDLIRRAFFEPSEDIRSRPRSVLAQLSAVPMQPLGERWKRHGST